MGSTLNDNASLDTLDWTLARSDMRVRAALIADVDAGRLSCEEAATAAGVGSNVVRTWRHRQRKALAAPVARVSPESPLKAAAIDGVIANGASCEDFEKAELDGLAGYLAKKAKRATDGKEAKAFVDAMSTAFDLRRRAHGLPTSREKASSALPKSSPLVFISAVPARVPLVRDVGNPVTVRSLESKTAEDEMPPALAALMAAQNLPAWQRAL